MEKKMLTKVSLPQGQDTNADIKTDREKEPGEQQLGACAGSESGKWRVCANCVKELWIKISKKDDRPRIKSFS
jgi:hypothetical protein